jgi:hypothetical protein
MNPFSDHTRIAEELFAIGWKSPNDAQWHHLQRWCEEKTVQTSLPIEDELRSKLKIAEEALVEIERGGCGTMCDDHPEGYHYLSCPWRIATYALARIRE